MKTQNWSELKNKKTIFPAPNELISLFYSSSDELLREYLEFLQELKDLKSDD